MRILVTGGIDFMGTNQCNELRSKGYKVSACYLYNTDPKSKRTSGRIYFIKCKRNK